MVTEVEKLLVRVEATQRKFEKQMDSMGKSAVRNAVKSETAWRKANTTIRTEADKTAKSFARLRNLSGNQRFVLQNTANQLGDIAVQIQGNAGAARALGQQLPQLLGGFGPLGAVLGTVAAIGIPVISTLIGISSETDNAGSRAEAAEKAISQLKSSVSAYAAAAAKARQPTSELRKEWGDLAEEARELFKSQEESARRTAVLDLGAGSDSITNLFGDIDIELLERTLRVIDRINQAPQPQIGGDGARLFALKEQSAALQTILQDLQLTEDGAIKVAQALAEMSEANRNLNAAEGIQEQNAAAAELEQKIENVRQAFVAAAGGVQNMSREQLAFNELLQKAEAEAQSLLNTSNAMPGALSAAASQAAALADQLDRAASNAAAALDAAGRAADVSLELAKIDLQFRNDPVGRATARADATLPQVPETIDRQRRQQLTAERETTVEKVRQTAELVKQKKLLDERDRKLKAKSRGGGGRRRSGGGGGGGSRSTGGATGLGFEGFTQSLREQTKLLREQAGALGEATSAQDLYAISVEKARTEEELLRRAQREGIAITPELRQKISELAQQYAEAKVQAGGLAQATSAVGQSGGEFASLGKSVLKGFISDLREGKSAAEALANAVQKIADRLLDIALDQLFAGFQGGGFGGGGGFLGGFLSLFGFRNGGQIPAFRTGGLLAGRGSGTSDSNLGIGPQGPMKFSKGEYLVNARAANENLPILEAINSGKFKAFAAGGALGPMAANSNQFTAKTKIVNALDGTQILSEALGRSSGEQVLLNRMKARPAAYRAALGL